MNLRSRTSYQPDQKTLLALLHHERITSQGTVQRPSRQENKMIFAGPMQKNNRGKAAPLMLIAVVVMLSQFGKVHAATTRTRTTSQCTIDSRGVHKCPSGAPEESNGLDPRAETFFAKKIPVSETSFKYEFEANYFVSSVTRTTILQFLNGDTSVSDRYKPVLFVVAWKKSNGKLKVCMFESCKYVWDDVPTGFRMRLKSSGRRALLGIAGRPSVEFDLIRPLNGAYRPRGQQELRWGVYHHDISGGRAASTAQVRVYNIASSGF